MSIHLSLVQPELRQGDQIPHVPAPQLRLRHAEVLHLIGAADRLRRFFLRRRRRATDRKLEAAAVATVFPTNWGHRSRHVKLMLLVISTVTSASLLVTMHY